MSIHVECGRAKIMPNGLPLEVAPGLFWSETEAVAGTTTNSAPKAARTDEIVVLTITAMADVWIAIGTAPDASAVGLRRRMLYGQTRTFVAAYGAKVAWAAT